MIPKCVLTGSSTHNERMEILWRDLYRAIIHFQDTFLHELEREETLDVMNDADMLAYVMCFWHDLRKYVKDFKQSWNSHCLSTEGNMTPYQLFFEGMRCATPLNIIPAIESLTPVSIAINMTIQPDNHIQSPKLAYCHVKHYYTN